MITHLESHTVQQQVERLQGAVLVSYCCVTNRYVIVNLCVNLARPWYPDIQSNTSLGDAVKVFF